MEWKGYENEVTRERMFDKFIEFMGKFAELKVVVALRDGFIMTTPFTICGSAFLLIANTGLRSIYGFYFWIELDRSIKPGSRSNF
ncbi:hypothetical protein [Pectinatus frisingensis]|uniref:hypothetical protein n=1 Tax=Pectinatus frisingensis TaxID=865 RepID=UPI002ED8E617